VPFDSVEDGNPAKGPTSRFPCVGDMEGRFSIGDGKELRTELDDDGRCELNEAAFEQGTGAGG